MSPIDVWDVSTFDSELTVFLRARAGLIQAYMEKEHEIVISHDLGRGPKKAILRPKNPYAELFYALSGEVVQKLQSRKIRAFHYTRLMESEVDIRGGSVCLNSSGAFPKWFSASVRLPSGLMAAR